MCECLWSGLKPFPSLFLFGKNVNTMGVEDERKYNITNVFCFYFFFSFLLSFFLKDVLIMLGKLN